MFTFALGHAWYAKWGMGMARGCAEHYYAVGGRDFHQSEGRQHWAYGLVAGGQEEEAPGTTCGPSHLSPLMSPFLPPASWLRNTSMLTLLALTVSTHPAACLCATHQQMCLPTKWRHT